MENLANGFTTTINHSGGYTSSATTITVASVTGAPAPNFRIIIDNEYMLVTGVSGSDLTVTRGIESSTPAAHAHGANVIQIITLGGLQQYLADRFPASTGGILTSRIAPINADTDATTIPFDCAIYDWHAVTLGGNRALTLINTTVGQQITLRLKQDSTGSRLVTSWFSGFTITWFTFDGNPPTLPTAADKIIVVTFKVTGASTLDGFVAGIQA